MHGVNLSVFILLEETRQPSMERAIKTRKVRNQKIEAPLTQHTERNVSECVKRLFD